MAVRVRRLLTAALGCALLVGGGPLPGTPAAAGAEGVAQSRVTLDIDYSRRPTLVVDARGVSADELMTTLARGMGFDVQRLGTPDPTALVRGRFVGELDALLPWLLAREDHIVVYRERPGGGRDVAQVLLLNSRAGGEAAASAAARGEADDAHRLRAYLDRLPDLNPDMRRWLQGLGEGDALASVTVNLSDAPGSVADMLSRVNEPLAPDFADRRLENRAPGTPPRYLTGANDAAQHDVASALARTSAMARHNLQILMDALDRACPSAGCPGISIEEIRARERRRQEEASRPKTAE